MPSKWTHESALEQLRIGDHFHDYRGLITPAKGYEPTATDYAAIDYLFAEWDYAYDSVSLPSNQDAKAEPR
jgi:hypothetical protein